MVECGRAADFICVLYKTILHMYNILFKILKNKVNMDKNSFRLRVAESDVRRKHFVDKKCLIRI